MSLNLVHYLQKRVSEHPDRMAVVIPVMEGQRCVRTDQATYAELAARIARCQAGWRKAGLQRGDRVIVLFRPCLDLYVMVISLIAMGLVPVFIDAGMPRQKILMAMQDANAKAIVSLKALVSKYWMIPALWPLLRFAVDGEGLGYRSARWLLEQPSQQGIEIVEVSDQDHGLISFTSGSTGRPKGADRTHASLEQQHLAIRGHLPDQDGDIDMTSFPVWVLHNLCCGMTTIMPKVDLAAPGEVDPALIVEQIEAFGISRVSAAPAFMKRLTDYAIAHEKQFEHVSLVFTGGAPVSVEIAANMAAVFPNATVEVVYGSTEAEPISSVLAPAFVSDARQHDGYLVGAPVEGVEVCIAQLPDCPVSEGEVTAASLAPLQIGEILVSGTHVLKAYVENDAATRENKVPRADGLVWHRTGDTGFFDEQGRIWLTGRVKDVVRVDGQWVQPFPFEKRVDDLVAIQRSAIIQVDGGEPHLFVVSTESFTDMITQIRPVLQQAGIPQIKVHRIDRIPMDARHNSKIDRPALREHIQQGKVTSLGVIMADPEAQQSDPTDLAESPAVQDSTSQVSPSSRFIIRLNWVDAVTLSSVFTTWLSIMLSLSGMLNLAMALLFLGMLADAFDGILARKFGLERAFGRYLDGFMDVLIYLVSPSLILYLSEFDGIFAPFIMLMIGVGCVRLAVFNDIGNIQESDGLSYLGMPVFWSIPIVGVHQLLIKLIDPVWVNTALAAGLLAFSYCMVLRRPFFKFTSLAQILSVTLGGFGLFLAFEFAASMPYDFASILGTALYLQWPIIVGGVLHMVVVAKDQFSFLKIPLNVAWFGANKTLRGLVVVPVFTMLGFWSLWPLEQWLLSQGIGPVITQHNLFLLGGVSGLLYVLAELPNSFLKRRLGAAPGETPTRYRRGFVLLDQIDSALFIAIGYGVFFDYHWTVCVLAFVLAPLIALSVKRVLFAARLKQTAT